MAARASYIGGPAHLQLTLRIAGTNYYSSSLAPAASLGRAPYVWLTNPATSAAFAPADLGSSNLQIGVNSVT
jgi:hypothetical protein